MPQSFAVFSITLSRGSFRLTRMQRYACPFDGLSSYQWFLKRSTNVSANFSENLLICSGVSSAFLLTILVRNTTAAAISSFMVKNFGTLNENLTPK